MWDVNQIIEALLRLFVVMIPVAAVILFFLAAHVIGGAMRPHRRPATSARLTTSPKKGSGSTQRGHASKTTAA